MESLNGLTWRTTAVMNISLVRNYLLHETKSSIPIMNRYILCINTTDHLVYGRTLDAALRRHK